MFFRIICIFFRIIAIQFIDPPLGGFGEILPEVMIFPSSLGNIVTKPFAQGL